ncbi:ribonuclease E/G [Henriciella sp.]|uniref:ribonuclease E/G n=1 Tax=Henriciella sp. TaxID=1968823 RepID=UPI00260291FD|nr:ribonuclease E/G [Henriciella sp.]
MKGHRIILHRAPAEMRAAAFDRDDRPVGLFFQRWNGQNEPARLGEVVSARLRQVSPGDGGAFFERDNGESLFVRGKLPAGLTEGAERDLEIKGEARRGKLARARLLNGTENTSKTALERWIDAFPGQSSRPEIADGPEVMDQVQAAFDEAMSSKIGLPRGGLIRLERTAALIAIDIDTAGRMQKGSAGARALSTNREAVAEAARQIALRDWGGLVVIDCISPITAEAGAKLRETFLKTFQAISQREVEALKPSPFGLLETKIAWGASPVEDRLLDETGKPTPETELLGLFREAEREAAASRAAFFRLTLSPHALKAYISRRKEADSILKSAFHGRVSIASGTGQASVVRRE